MKEQFNLEKYNRMIAEGKTPTIVTRDGMSARIICTDKKGDYPVVAAILENENTEGVITYSEDGRYAKGSKLPSDLFFADLEPTYRPYKDKEECFKDVQKHGGWVRQKRNGVYFHLIVVDDNEVNYTEHVSETFKRFLEQNVWADDGSPCGRLIEE